MFGEYSSSSETPRIRERKPLGIQTESARTAKRVTAAAAGGRRELTDLGELFHGLGQVSEVFVQDVRHHLQGRAGHGMPTDVGAYPGDRRGQAVPDELVRHFLSSSGTRTVGDRDVTRPVKRPLRSRTTTGTALGRAPFPRTNALRPRSPDV